MLPNFSGVEFQRTVSKCRKRKRKRLSFVPVLYKTWNEALSRCSRAVTNKPIAFLPFSLPWLCRREAGEKEKRNKKARGVWWEVGRYPRAFNFPIFAFLYWDNQREPLRRREASYGLAPIVTNIVWILGSSKYTDTDICQIPFERIYSKALMAWWKCVSC